MNDTPRTNDIIEQVKGFRTSSALYSLEQFSRLLERELTDTQDKIQTLSEIGIDQMDKERALRLELTAVTEHLTKAHETIGTMIDEIGMLQLKDKATTEQRDRLAEALRKIKNAGGTYTDPYDELDFIDGITYEALQSLTTNA